MLFAVIWPLKMAPKHKADEPSGMQEQKGRDVLQGENKVSSMAFIQA